MVRIDTNFDVRSDSGGKDPDSHSPTLREYHRLLWSKPLPGGEVLTLDDKRRGSYLHHRSELGEFFLGSDSVIPTYSRWVALRPILANFPESDVAEFLRLAYTIGGMVVWPADRIDGKQTINGARGFNRRICDRMDLTLECIRRHYLGGESPLAAVLDRYRAFFDLFGEFRGYVDFFLFQDLVDPNCEVRFFLPFTEFAGSPVPRDAHEYLTYMEESQGFIRARNARIEEWARDNSEPPPSSSSSGD